ncbi:ABC-2 type transport system ATP-binding protein [Mycolicibacterium rutilum]|uniref:ABC-2 type transport system ATP-binding protein n=1 Tax=Mycolicibacterium rutilum TaxID=370526 RepID=A0A1H6KCA2_MYCRU|nr:CocE/NonD family hydrolase [Mycolicibacterium rutilum]SEH73110.1 ABC-2 type transport system ATP-binding protein [Mycolicibacterium rutilum]
MSYRIGGLAVALGIGSAVVVGHGVAAADPADAGAASDTSTTSAAESTTDESSESKPTEAPKDDEKTPAAEDSEESDEAKDDDADDTAKPAKKRSNKIRAAERDTESDAPSRATATVNATRVERTETEPKTTVVDAPRAVADVASAPADDAPVVTISAVTAPVEQPRPKDPPPDPVEVATVAVSQAVNALFGSTGEDTPSPMESAAAWTMAAAARRELADPTTESDEPATRTTTALTDAATPQVIAIPQTPPLEFLQHIPVIGPVFVTPLVAAIHQIPVVGDVLHPFIGYPLRPGGPAPRDVKVISADGTAIYVHFMPARGLSAGDKAPTILNGPGLGLPGATNIDGTILDDIMVDTFGIIGVGALRDAGYNVVTWDPRGEWNSGGRLELNAAEFEGRDMSAIIDWVATQPEALLDTPGDPRLGMTGVSYGGGIQLVTAANDHRVDAIVPTITYHSFNTSLYKAEAFKTSWATLLTGVLALTMARTNPRILPAAIYGGLTGMMLPADEDLLTSRNPLIENITVPTLLIQGTVDTVFSAQEADATAQILMANGVPTKVVWFCGGHGVCANNFFDMRDGQVIEQRTLQWLDRYVKNVAGTPTGPQFEWVDQRGQWFSSDEYPVKKGTPIVATAGAATLPLIPYLGGSGIPFVPYALKAFNAVNVALPKATETTYVVGAPELTLTYSGTGTSRHVYAQLVDNTTGLVLGSLITPVPVTLDGKTHTVTVSLEPVAHTLRPDESVTLQLVSSSGTYERILPSLGVLNIEGVGVSLPTADAAVVSSPTTVQVTTAA